MARLHLDRAIFNAYRNYLVNGFPSPPPRDRNALRKSAGHSPPGNKNVVPALGMPYKLPVRIIALRTLRIFGDRHPEARSSLKAWRTAVEAASFQNMNEVIAAFSKAKMITGLRARFEVAGGNYRLIASFNFRRQEVFVKFLGTHAEYDAVDAATGSQF